MVETSQMYSQEKKGIGPEEIPPLCKNGTIIYANKEKADTLNDFFIEQATLEIKDDPLPRYISQL